MFAGEDAPAFNLRMSDESKAFTVTDRRHFTKDGEVRSTEEESAAEDVPTPARTAYESESPEPEVPPHRGAADAVGFQEFLVSLGAQAAALLMEAETGSVQERAAGVRHFIALLEMLEDKTEGRRTPAEEKVLSQLLYELRAGYLASFKAS